jgi:hypothetical protein
MGIDLFDTARAKTEPIQSDEPIQDALPTGLDHRSGTAPVGTVVVDRYDEAVVDGIERLHWDPDALRNQRSHLDSAAHQSICERIESPWKVAGAVVGAAWTPFLCQPFTSTTIFQRHVQESWSLPKKCRPADFETATNLGVLRVKVGVGWVLSKRGWSWKPTEVKYSDKDHKVYQSKRQDIEFSSVQ